MNNLLHTIYNVYRDPGCDGFGHSFLLKRKAGNVLIPRMVEDTTIEKEYAAIDAIGGIKTIFITDYHFGGASTESIAARFGAEVLSSIIEQPKLAKKGLKTLKPFAFERQFLAEDLEIIPVPGHTSGGVCLLWKEGKRRYLFTGDFLYFDGKAWIPGSKTKSKIEESLRLIKTLTFDYLVGCGSDNVDVPYIALPDIEAKTRFIDGILSGFKK